jgi:hypothetical protein
MVAILKYLNSFYDSIQDTTNDIDAERNFPMICTFLDFPWLTFDLVFIQQTSARPWASVNGGVNLFIQMAMCFVSQSKLRRVYFKEGEHIVMPFKPSKSHIYVEPIELWGKSSINFGENYANRGDKIMREWLVLKARKNLSKINQI